MHGKRNKNYEGVMSRVYNRSRSSLVSSSYVTRHENASSVRVGAKASNSNLSSGIFSELPVVLDDYVPVSSREKVVKKSNVVKPRRTVKSLDPGKSPSRVVAEARESRRIARKLSAEGSIPTLVIRNNERWSDSHVRQCFSSRSHSKLKELKDEIKAYNEREKLLRLRSELYKKCGVVLDDVGGVAVDKGVQAAAVEPNTECKAYWYQLRNSYRNAVSRRMKADKSVKFKSWTFDDEMSFLLPFILPRQTRFNAMLTQCDKFTNNDDITRKRKSQEFTTKTQHLEVADLTMAKPTRTSTQDLNGQDADDIDLFFESLTKIVKKFPELERIKLKFNIMKMVNEVEIRCRKSNAKLKSNTETTSNHSAQVALLESDTTGNISIFDSKHVTYSSSSFECPEQFYIQFKQELSDNQASESLEDCMGQSTNNCESDIRRDISPQYYMQYKQKISDNQTSESSKDCTTNYCESDTIRNIATVDSKHIGSSSSSLFVHPGEYYIQYKQELSDTQALESSEDCMSQCIENDPLVETNSLNVTESLQSIGNDPLVKMNSLNIIGSLKTIGSQNWPRLTLEAASNNTVAAITDQNSRSLLYPKVISVISLATCKEEENIETKIKEQD